MSNRAEREPSLFSISCKQYMAVVLLLLCGTFLSHSGAQVLDGSLTGNITDPNGHLSLAPKLRPLTERFTFQFRAEAFGVTNTPHFSNPNVACCTSNNLNFGVITSTLGGNSGTNLNGARTIWFAGKLLF